MERDLDSLTDSLGLSKEEILRKADRIVREVAAVLDISVTATKGRLHRTRGQLRERLSPLMTGACTEVLGEKEEKKGGWRFIDRRPFGGTI